MVQAIADGAEEVTPVQPVAESKPEATSDEDVVSTLKKSQTAATEREAGEQVQLPAFVAVLMHSSASEKAWVVEQQLETLGWHLNMLTYKSCKYVSPVPLLLDVCAIPH